MNAVAHNYAVVEQLSQNEVFLKLSNQRQVVTNLTVELLKNDESSDFDTCDDEHTSEVVLKCVLRVQHKHSTQKLLQKNE
ncbi:hypothetical protein HPB48_019803 [Haemaphysalis longicornis]|uniref:Uncharacterized protein n=1 Tax=Haemaphysalis longicornis TaxID=44386 RepID=A0A9J6GF67_HAELO|nr:hypothetical protein HPB48_019803 [Haemaphysalis longicornis]